MKKPAFVILLVLIGCGLAFAQDSRPLDAPPGPEQGPDPGQNQSDPPGRVARLNYIQGSVSFEPAGTQQWVDANPNRPLTTGDNLWADMNSRGEVHVGSTAIRLSAQTGLSIMNLNDQAVQFEVPQGSVDLHVRDLADSEAYEVDTPNLAMTILRPGDYRIDVDPNGTSSTITLRSGSAEVTAAGKAYSINPGQQYVFTGTDQLTYDMLPAPPRDEFDSWSVSRDQLEDRSPSARYVSRDVIGYEDLDRYGAWSTDPDYGPVWVPSGVPIGWAPYHYGHWVYVAPWGWTWVEDEPWGFAPFHYGRWALVSGGWAWVPGPVVAVGVRVRPVYAPALVGFVGGGGFGVSFALGGGVAGVAWFPLGPRDVWVPAYRCSPRYVENINITNTRVVNVTQVRNVYVNRTTVINNYTYAHNTVAVTAVNRETFVSGQPVARSTVRVSNEVIAHPQVIQSARLEPTQRSAFGPAASARALPPATLANRPVVTKMTPSPHAVAVGHTQPLVTERMAYRPSVPANGGGQFNQPAGKGPTGPAAGNNNTGARLNTGANNGYHPFTPPNRNGGNANGTAGTNPGNQPNGRGNSNTTGAAGSTQPPTNPNNGYRPPNPTGGNAAVKANGGGSANPPHNNEEQPRSTMRYNPGSQPPPQPAQNENRGAQGGGNSGGNPHGNIENPPHPNNNEKQPKKDNRHDDPEHGR